MHAFLFSLLVVRDLEPDLFNMRFFAAFATVALAAQAAALSIGGKHMVVERDSDGLQDIVGHLKLHSLSQVLTAS